jgi:PqqD family protein of HPr-rel-A system
MADAPTQSTELSTLRWQAVATDALCWAHFGDKWALYHRPSGKTHFVNDATVWLLRDLLTQPLTIAEVTPLLLASASQLEQVEIRATTGELLLRLEELGLVECR